MLVHILLSCIAIVTMLYARRWSAKQRNGRRTTPLLATQLLGHIFQPGATVLMLVADENGQPEVVPVHADALAALQSEGPLDPVILQGTIHGVGNEALVVLDWFNPMWARDGEGRFLFRAREVRMALTLAQGGIPIQFTRLVERIGSDELRDVHDQYRGMASFMLFLQANTAILYRLTLQVSDQLYPADPLRLRAALSGLHERLNPIELFKAATHVNDGLLMLLAACHSMYMYRTLERAQHSPRGVFTGVDEDIIRRIRVCESFVSGLFAAHLAKGRFQHHLLAAAKCDLNSLTHLHGWRPRPMIASGTTPPDVSLGCDPCETYGQLPWTAMSVHTYISEELRSLALHTRLAALQIVYPGRRGPCYQAALSFMVHRVDAARRWNVFPALEASLVGSDTRPGEDTRVPPPTKTEAPFFPCASCKASITGFINEQHLEMRALLRNMFEDGSANYFGIDIHSLRSMALRQPGVNEALFPQDLEHVFDDIPGPYSHPNLALNGNVDLPWTNWAVPGNGAGWGDANAGGGWGGGGGWGQQAEEPW